MKLTPINGDTETEGTEFIYRGTKLLVARAGNVEYRKAFRELMKPLDEEFEAGRLSNEQSEEILIEASAKGVLVGWEDFTDVEGNEFEYSVENAIELLTDDKDVYEAITKFSENINNYLVESVEKLKGK